MAKFGDYLNPPVYGKAPICSAKVDSRLYILYLA